MNITNYYQGRTVFYTTIIFNPKNDSSLPSYTGEQFPGNLLCRMLWLTLTEVVHDRCSRQMFHTTSIHILGINTMFALTRPLVTIQAIRNRFCSFSVKGHKKVVNCLPGIWSIFGPFGNKSHVIGTVYSSPLNVAALILPNRSFPTPTSFMKSRLQMERLCNWRCRAPLQATPLWAFIIP